MSFFVAVRAKVARFPYQFRWQKHLNNKAILLSISYFHEEVIQKRKRRVGSDKTETTDLNQLIRNFYREFGVTQISQTALNHMRNIFPLSSEANHTEKLHFLLSNLQLDVNNEKHNKQIGSLCTKQVGLLKESMENLKRKEQIFHEIITASLNPKVSPKEQQKELIEKKRKMYLVRRIVSSMPADILDLQIKLLTQQYHIPKAKIFDVLIFHRYPISFLKEMVDDVVLRQTVFRLIGIPFDSSEGLGLILRKPELLSIPPKYMYEMARGYVRGCQFSTIRESKFILVIPQLFYDEEKIINRLEMMLSLFTGENLQRKNPLDQTCILPPFDQIQYDRRAQKKITQEYQALIHYQTPSNMKRITKPFEQRAKEQLKRLQIGEKLFLAFQEERQRQRTNTEQMEISKEIIKSHSKLRESNPYFQLLELVSRKLLELRLDQSLKISREEFQILSITWGKIVIEGMKLSPENAKELVQSAQIATQLFPNVLEKLLAISMVLRLTTRELERLIRTTPDMAGYSVARNITAKLRLLQPSFDELVRDRWGRPNSEEIRQHCTYKEKKDYPIIEQDPIRSDPVLILIRTCALQNPDIFRSTAKEWEAAITVWTKWKGSDSTDVPRYSIYKLIEKIPVLIVREGSRPRQTTAKSTEQTDDEEEEEEDGDELESNDEDDDDHDDDNNDDEEADYRKK